LYVLSFCVFFSTSTARSALYTLSLHDALPIYFIIGGIHATCGRNHYFCFGFKHLAHGAFPFCGFIISVTVSIGNRSCVATVLPRSEEHTSELQSRFDLVCRLLLEKTKKHE